jgi:protein O-mannosyl-transferase
VVEQKPPLLSLTDKLRIGFLLLFPTILAFSPLLSNSYQFINLDDPQYITQNPHVLTGVSSANVKWAFTTIHSRQWMPLTWMSLQLDAAFFGSNPSGYHLTNLLLHSATVLLLAYTLIKMTGMVWRSVMVAALFAVHPLRTESVAWIAERKDVLSGLLWMATLAVYVWYAKQPSWRRYLLVVLGFAAGLLAKPMAVTLPFALLLLDYWPLRRIFPWQATASEGGGLPPPSTTVSLPRLIAEKLPLIVLSVAMIVVTLHGKQSLVMNLTSYSWQARLKNVVVSYVRYLKMMVYPADLALFYPHRGEALPWDEAVASIVVLVAITVSVVWMARRKPYLLVGWFWYLGTLVPVIGLVQLTSQALADRFTYIPSVGLLLVAVWGISELARRWPRQDFVALISGLLVLGCTALTWLQVHYWENSRILWTHTLAFFGLILWM